MAAPRGKSTQAITNYKLEVGKLVDQMQRLVEQGKSVKDIYNAVGDRVEELRKQHARLSGSMKGAAERSKSAAKNQKDLDQANANLNLRLRALSATYKELERIENEVLSTTRQEIAANGKLAKSINKNASESKKLITEEEKQRKLAQERLKQILKKNQALRRQGKENSRLKEKIDKLEKSSKKLNKTTEKSTKSNKKFSTRISAAIRTLGAYGVAYNLINAAQRIFSELTIGSIRESIKFQKELSNLAAVAGVAGEAVKQLGENALEVAGRTKFTATQVIGLQTSLAKLGFTSDEIIESTQGIANTAQALGTPLEEVAESTGKVINQFSLLIEQSSFVGDVLVTTINNSALSFDSFGTAIQYVGPIAKNLGLSLEQTAGAMAVLADNGFTASRVGTGLRGIFTELGKTSSDVEQSLRDLAEENLSLSEAVDLVGKRNAAQLITLLNNIDALNVGTGSYYKQGRALQSAAKSVDNFSGQMDLLNSAFKEFQIRSGFFIANSDIVLRILDDMFPAAAKAGRGFKAINKVGFEEFNKGAKDVADGANSLNVALRLLNISEEKYSETLQKLGSDLAYVRRNANSTILEIEGLRDKLIEVGEENRKQSLILQGQTQAANEYEESIKKITQAYIDGENVNDEINRINAEINQKIKEYNSIIETSIKNETDLFTGRTKAIKVDEDQILVYKGLVEVLESYNTQLINSTISQAQLQRIFDETQRKAEREAFKVFKEDLVSLIKNIKETEKAISDLPESLSDKAFSQQIDLLNGFFGSAEDIIAQATKRFGPNSELTKALVKILKAASDKIKVDLPKDPFADVILDYSDLGAFDEGDVDGVTKVAKTAAEKIRDAFEGVELGEVIAESLETAAEAISGFNDTALENTKNRLNAEKDSIENRYQIEQDILKSQLDNQLITESQFRQKQRDLQKAKVAEENAIDKQIFDSEKKRDRQNASTDYLQAIASIIPTLIAYDKTADPVSVLTKAAITGALATAAYGAELAAIGQRKFFPKKFEQGGMVSGPSHNEGGVPFSVQGQGGYEMEGGEFIVNKRATAKHYDLLQRINDSYRTAPKMGRMKFADGGLINSPMNESVDYLKAIAEATTSTAIGVSKPVRAYVSDKDLRTNATERRIRDRNDRL
jgi:hypothetical protein